MYNEEENKNREDIFEESDVRIPDDRDPHIYRKVEEDGSLADQATPEFGSGVDQTKHSEHGADHSGEQTYWEGSTYRQSFVRHNTQQDMHRTDNAQQYSYRTDEPQKDEKRSFYKEKSHSTGKHGGNHGSGKMHPFLKSVICGVIIGVIAGGCVLGSFAIGNNMNSGSEVSAADTDIPTTGDKLGGTSEAEVSANEETSAPAAEAAEQQGYTVSQIAAQCQSSVVAITNKGVSEVHTFFGTMEQENEGSGSGVIVGKNESELLVVTNNHVVEGANELTVCFNDDENAVYEAQVKGTDPANDLSVVAIPLKDISADVMQTISIATLGDSDTLHVGDSVVAIGNALGMGQSVTSGVISATSREVTIEGVTATLLQTDAAINPGNSGGALFNMQGELIGINSAKYASAAVEGMGFAIPITSAQPIMDELMNRTTRTKLTENYGYLNISGSNVSADVTEMYGVPAGVYIAGVQEDGAAANAGMQEGDILTTFDGITITSIEQLKNELQYYEAGATVDVIVQRNSGNGYEEVTLQVTLDAEMKMEQPASTPDQSQEEMVPDESGEYTDPFSGFFPW